MKTPNTQTKNAGEVIEFEIVVANAGPGTATGVQLNDPLPSGTGISWSVSAGYPTGQGGLTPPSCSVAGSPQVLTCTSVDIPSGQGYTVRVRSNTAFASCAVYNNTATISGTNFANDDDAGQITVQCPDLTIEKTPDAGVVANGGTMVFGIRITNARPGTATNVVLSDPLPAGTGVTAANWSIVATYPQGIGGLTPPTCSITGAVGTQTLGCVGVNIPAGQGYEVRVQAVTSAATCGTFDNTATFTASNHASENDAGRIEVDCVPGCTLTIGFWKTHTGLGNGNQIDEVTQYLPIWLGTAGVGKSIQVTTVQQAQTLLSTMGSNGIDKLYAQLLATKLNLANGSPAGYAGLAANIAAADAFLATKNSSDWSSLNKNQKNQVLAWMTFFDTYNNTGPHCL